MATIIGPQHGLEASRVRENELHPEFAAAWDKRSATMKILAANNDELIPVIAGLQQEVAELKARPFV